MAETPQREKPIGGDRAIIEYLGELGHGTAVADMSREFEEFTAYLFRHWREHGACKGGFTIKIGVKVDKDGMMLSAYDVVQKLPPPERKGAITYFNKAGQLVRQNPQQEHLNFGVREVPTKEPKPRELAAAEEE